MMKVITSYFLHFICRSDWVKKIIASKYIAYTAQSTAMESEACESGKLQLISPMDIGSTL